MSSKLQSVRGTQDFLPAESARYRLVESVAFQIAQLYGFEEIKTPLFEFSEVFHRSLGDTSDAVSKETYDFLDRGGDKLTLRPEGTAGVVRAFISNGMAQNLPLKLFYSGPMFRYERPQKGRYRQFHQIGVEALGFENAQIDVECIALANQILSELGISEKTQIEINTLGDKESRQKHRDALVQFLTPFKSELSSDSQIRLEKNPLRILDTKDEKDKRIIQNAPSLEKYLNDSSKKYFDEVMNGLSILNLKPVINRRLVRGLDYYTHTVFEITTQALGAQSAVIAGGRYDGLVEQMGGPATTGFGWGAGIERLMLLIEQIAQPSAHVKTIAVISADDSSIDECLKISQQLRQNKKTVELLVSGNVGKKMKRANKLQAQFAVIIGEQERQQKQAAVKNLTTGEQKSIDFDQLVKFFDEF